MGFLEIRNISEMLKEFFWGRHLHAYGASVVPITIGTHLYCTNTIQLENSITIP